MGCEISKQIEPEDQPFDTIENSFQPVPETLKSPIPTIVEDLKSPSTLNFISHNFPTVLKNPAVSSSTSPSEFNSTNSSTNSSANSSANSSLLPSPKSPALTLVKETVPLLSLINLKNDNPFVAKMYCPIWCEDYEVYSSIVETGPYSISSMAKEIIFSPSNMKLKINRIIDDEATKINLSSSEILLFKPDWWKRIKQGRVGTSMAMASLVALGSVESKIEKPIISGRLFPQNVQGYPIVSLTGIYHFRGYVNGIDRVVPFDDKLLAYSRFDQYDYKMDYFAASQSTDDSEWGVSLLEKAYIQWTGESYNIRGEIARKSLSFFSDFLIEDTVRIDSFVDKVEGNVSINDKLPPEKAFGLGHESGFGGKKSYWEDLVSNFKTGNVVGVLSSVYDEEEGQDIIPSHAYALVDIYTLPNKTKLFRVINPLHNQPVKASFDESGKSKWAKEIKELTGEEPPSLVKELKRTRSVIINKNRSGEIDCVEFHGKVAVKKKQYIKKKCPQEETGEFYLTFDMLKSRFDDVTLSWNSSLFTHEKKLTTIYKEGDIFDKKKQWSHAPQFLLHKEKGIKTWIQVMRHFPPYPSSSSSSIIDLYDDLFFQIRVKRHGSKKPEKPKNEKFHNDDDVEDNVNYKQYTNILTKCDDDYVGFYTITIHLFSPPEYHGDITFTIRVVSTGDIDDFYEL